MKDYPEELDAEDLESQVKYWKDKYNALCACFYGIIERESECIFMNAMQSLNG